MLTVFTGAFHPGLEKGFLDRLAQLKSDPMAPVAIVAPSSRMADRLQLALAESGFSYVNLHFHTFASLAEAIVDGDAPLEKPVLSDPLFFDTLVKQIVRDDKPFETFEELAMPNGFPPAVRGTLRDLLDAGINQENVDALVQEGFAGKDVDLGSLRSLLNLHRSYLRGVGKLSVFPRAEMLNKAIQLASQSEFLKGFDEIIYYGFYDLTGLQSDFFQTVVKNFPSSFFFPFIHNHPAYGFAKRFWDVFVQPVKGEEIVLAGESGRRGDGERVRILNVSGLRDEAWFVANEIRRLHDQEKIAFSDMAVIARTKDRLGFLIQEALYDRRVPYRASSHPSLVMFPVAQEALKMLEAHAPEPSTLSWKDAVALAEKTVPMEGVLLDGVRSLVSFDEIHPRVSWENFVETLRDRWSRTEVRDPNSSDAGVSLLYAEASRGLPFKIIFLIGMEEKIFPRIVNEDPFLRDDAREALNGIGHKISKKMTALEEERLLFELILSSASERLFLLYQRSDDEGSVVGASPFLRSFAEENGIELGTDTDSLPRPLLAKIKTADPAIMGASDLMVGLLAAQKNADAARLAELTRRDKKALEQGLVLQKALHSFKAPGAYDGVIGKMGTADVFYQGKISATNLEVYGQCGFKYFASRMLNLAPLETDEPEEALAAHIRGKLVHTFIETFFRRVTKEGAQPPPAKFPPADFDAIFEEIVTAAPPEEAKIPFVLWQATRASLRAILTVFLTNELELLAAEGARPALFEAVVEGRLPPPLDGFLWTGKIDRIDMKGDATELLDYKTGRPFEGKTVSLLAEKGEKLQAPLYLSLSQEFLEKLGKKAASFSFRYEFVDHPGHSRVMDAEDWTLKSKAILGAIRALVDAALSGNFMIKPGWYCDYCQVVRVCRKNHGISVYRAEQAALK